MEKIGFLVLTILISGCSTSPSMVLDLGERDFNNEPSFEWPVYGAVVTQKFRPHRAAPYSRAHKGIDLAAQADTPIRAVDHGVVVYAGHGYTGYGRLVIVQHLKKEYRSYYAHLSRYKVEKGDFVHKGDMVGLMGRSGRATGVHLHFELHRGDLYVDPLDVLPSSAVSGLQASP